MRAGHPRPLRPRGPPRKRPPGSRASRKCGRSDSGGHRLRGGPLGHILSCCERIHRVPAVAPGKPHHQPDRSVLRSSLLSLGHGPLWLEAAALATGLVAACAVWCAWAWSLTHGLAQRQGEEHGTARWGTVRGGRRFMNTEDADENVILTEHFGMAMSRPDHDRRYERNRNVLVVGGSGSGKTRGFFEPNVMQMNANYLVTDPKGESLPRLGRMLDAAGYKVLSFNTVDFSKSLHYNPIAYIADEADILEFVTCLIDNTTGDKEHAGDPFWENAERLLYVALIGYLVYHCPPADPSLSGLVTLLSLAKAKESDEDYRSPLDLLFEEVETGMRYVRRPGGAAVRPHAPRVVRPGGPPLGARVGAHPRGCRLLPSPLQDVQGRRREDPEVDPRVLQHAHGALRDTPGARARELRRDGARPARGRVRAPGRIRRHVGHILPLLVPLRHHDVADHEPPLQAGHKALRGCASHARCHAHGRVRQHRRLPDVEKMVAVVRSRNISMAFGLQSLSQLKSAYKDDAATIIDCCDTTLFLGGKSTDTVKEIAESIGKETVATITWNESRGASASTPATGTPSSATSCSPPRWRGCPETRPWCS